MDTVMQEKTEKHMTTRNNGLRWLYLVLGTASLLFCGIIYGWSILKMPLSTEFGWAGPALSLNFTLTMCFFCIGGMVGGALTKKIGLRFTLFISAVLACLGFIIASGMNGRIAVLYISYGLLSGLGIGIAYNAIISTVNAWFPDKKGLCSGILMMGFGASALVVGSLADRMIESPAFGWRAAYRIIGIALGGILVLAGLFLKKNESSVGSAQTVQKDSCDRDFTTAEMLRSAKFWKAFLVVIFLAAVGNTVISMAKDLSLSVGIAPSSATLLVGILSLCNGIGRVITGAVFDRFGRRTTMIGANIAAMAAAGIVLVAVLIHSPLICVIGLCLAGLSYGTGPTISSAFTSESFGTRYFPMNFAVMNCNLLCASFIATGTSLISEASGHYAGAFITLLALTAAALLLNLSLKD